MILHPRTARFSGNPFTGAQPACACGGRGVCIVCEAAGALQMEDLKRSAGGSREDAAADFCTKNPLDRPFPAGNIKELPYIRATGQALGIPRMRNARPEDLTNPVTIRACNLASLVARAMLRLPEDKRLALLDDLGGMGWAQGVTGFAAQAVATGKMAPTEAVAFALSLRFTVGILNAKTGEDSPDARAYVKAYKLATGASTAAQADMLGITRRADQPSGFAGFGLSLAEQIGQISADLQTAADKYAAISAQLADHAAKVANLPPARNTLEPNTSLDPSDPYIVSPDGRTILLVSPAGLYVVYNTGVIPILKKGEITPDEILRDPVRFKQLYWNGPPAGKSFNYVYMGTDGRMGLYAGTFQMGVGWVQRDAAPYFVFPDMINPNDADRMIKRTPVANARLVVQNDGNVVAYAPTGAVVFSLETYQKILSLLVSKFLPPPYERDLATGDFQCAVGGFNPRVAGIRIAFKRVFLRDPTTAEVNYYGKMRWCIDPDGLLGGKQSTLEQAMLSVRARILNGEITTTAPPPDTRDLEAPRSAVGQAISDLFDKGVQAVGDVICAGFKKILPESVAGVLCAIINFVIGYSAAVIQAAAQILVALAEGVLNFLKFFLTGQFVNAITALMEALTKVIFLVMTPYVSLGTFVSDPLNPTSAPAGVRYLMNLADRVSKKEPLFALNVAVAVIVMITAYKLGPDVQRRAGVGLALALTPMAAGVIADVVYSKVTSIRQFGFEVVELGVTNVYRLCVVLYEGILSARQAIAATFSNIVGQVETNGALKSFVCDTTALPPGTPPEETKSTWVCTKEIMKRLYTALDPANPRSITAAVKKLNLNDMVSSAQGFLTAIPAVIVLLGTPAVEGSRDLRLAIDTWFASAGDLLTLTQQQEQMRAGAQKILQGLSDLEKLKLLLSEQSLMPPDNSAKLVAETLWERVGRDGISDAARAAYFKAMRDAWIAKGGKV